VTSVLASYRAFDTLGEAVVILTAGIGVLALLLVRHNSNHKDTADSCLQQHKVLRVVGKILIPPIMIFALYVQFHGEYGPGGGFQAGVIFAAGLILYTMLFGLRAAKKVVRFPVVRVLAAMGVLIYGMVGVVNLLSGKNFLDYSSLAADAITAQHIGIMIIELGVGMTVAAVMLLIYFAFADYKPINGGGE
jgi:multicomponent Na+:H+ antiporter subunit B